MEAEAERVRRKAERKVKEAEDKRINQRRRTKTMMLEYQSNRIMLDGEDVLLCTAQHFLRK
jgi:hypothetical protein